MARRGLPLNSELVSATFLVAGTCIGGGMLALPVATGISGIVPSLVMMGICWLAMTLSALLLLEVSMWMQEGAHIISMTSRFLGLPGKAVSWVLYLYISYASLVAYTDGGGGEIACFFTRNLGVPMVKGLGSVLFVLVFGLVIYLGSNIVGRVNSILFVAMIFAYLALVGMGVDEVKATFYHHRDWSSAAFAVPLLLTSFSFQTMVPSLTPILKKHGSSIRLAIISGTSMAFVVYAIWQWLILGIVPLEGPDGLKAALIQGVPATQFLSHHVQGYLIPQIASFFALFAIITSFLGIALGLFDFLADGLSIPKKGLGQLSLGLMIAIPTLFCAIHFERIFLVALDTTGGFGDSILNGIIPILMVWIGRYRMGMKSSVGIPGGKPVLTLLCVFFLGVLILEVLLRIGYFGAEFMDYDLLEINAPEEICYEPNTCSQNIF